MTLVELAAAHPFLACVLVFLVGQAVASAIGAAVEPLKTWKRPGDCPRCGGTGRDP